MADKQVAKKIKLPNVRLSFPYLYTPRENERDDGTTQKQFEATALLDKVEHADQIKQIQRAILEVAKDKFGSGVKPSQFKHPLRPGMDKEHLEGYDSSNMFITARTMRKPPVRNQYNQPVAEGEDFAPYGGCYVNIWVSFFVAKKPKPDLPNRVSCSLEGVQFKAEGEAFGSGNLMEEDDWDTEEGGPDADTDWDTGGDDEWGASGSDDDGWGTGGSPLD